MNKIAIARRTADGLGFFSLGLGLFELLSPGELGSGLGLDRPNLFRTYGVREILAGVGLLAGRKSQKAQAAFLWARVAGDVLDLATLAFAKPSRPEQRTALGVAVGSVVGVLLVDVLAAAALSRD